MAKNDISSIKRTLFSRNFYVCEYNGCYKRATDLAHRVANTEENVKMIKRMLYEMYNADLPLSEVRNNFIHNPANLAVSCRQHNDYFNIGHDMMAVTKLIKFIWEKEYGQK